MGAGVLAGCGGRGREGPTPFPDDGSGDRTPVPADEDTVVSRVAWNWAVGDTDFNRFSAASNYPNGQTSVFFDPMVSYSPTEEAFRYELADGAPFMEGCELHVPLKEGYTWWDGTPVTARDRVVLGSIVPYFCCGGPEEVPWESQLVEEYEFMEVKVGQFNEAFASINMLQGIRAKADYWKPFLERLEDASTDDAVQNVVKEIRDKQVTMDEVIQEGLGYGLWKPVEYTTSTLTLEKYEDHPNAEKTDVERWQWRVIPTEQSFIQAFKQDTLDYGSTEYRTNVQNPPEAIEEVVSYPGRQGRKVGLSWRNRHFARRPVRRAINYVMDLEGLASVVGNVTPVTQQTAGMPDSLVEKWLGTDFLDRLIDYGTQSRPEKAAEVMRAGGYERRNGVWTDEDGDRMQGLRFIATSDSDSALLGDTISGQLADFGIRTDFSALEPGSYQNVMSAREGSGDFDLVIDNAGPSAPHPSRIWGYVRSAVVDNWQISANINEPEECGTAPPNVEWTEDTSPVFRIPTDPAPPYPETVGRTELDGDGQHLDPIRSASEMRLDVGEERIREIARQWAWWVNFNAFHTYLHSFDRSLWMDTDLLQIEDQPVLGGTAYGQGPLTKGSVSFT
jgi:ABC-type transport system substrate-binding protein